jgi:hypothetical protein
MAKAGYSTQPTLWKKQIIGAIKKYKLYLNDTLVEAQQFQ